jgi:hypothetical protein
MNRKQQTVLFLVVVALIVTWLFPPSKIFGEDLEGHTIAGVEYQFLANALHIDWGRLLLTDLIITAAGAPLLYVLRSKR